MGVYTPYLPPFSVCVRVVSVSKKKEHVRCLTQPMGIGRSTENEIWVKLIPEDDLPSFEQVAKDKRVFVYGTEYRLTGCRRPPAGVDLDRWFVSSKLPPSKWKSGMSSIAPGWPELNIDSPASWHGYVVCRGERM